MSEAHDQTRPALTTRSVEVAPGVRVHEDDLVFSYARSSGPGGQNVNKVATKAVLRVRVADVPLRDHARARLMEIAGFRLVNDGAELLFSSDAASRQETNRENVLAELRKLLVAAMFVPKARKKRKVSRAAKARRVDAKRRRGETKRQRRSHE